MPDWLISVIVFDTVNINQRNIKAGKKGLFDHLSGFISEAGAAPDGHSPGRSGGNSAFPEGRPIYSIELYNLFIQTGGRSPASHAEYESPGPPAGAVP
jgi:hypothetical protein